MKKNDDVRIVILHRGWVAVGKYSKEGTDVILTDAATIRRWGTKKGLGEIAAEGPKSNTILDLTPTVRVHEMAVIASIECNAELWADALRR